jgi:hypothetical protein
VSAGLPAGDKGKIGLAVTPADPSIVYATIEASAEERGFYRSQAYELLPQGGAGRDVVNTDAASAASSLMGVSA